MTKHGEDLYNNKQVLHNQVGGRGRCNKPFMNN